MIFDVDLNNFKQIRMGDIAWIFCLKEPQEEGQTKFTLYAPLSNGNIVRFEFEPETPEEEIVFIEQNLNDPKVLYLIGVELEKSEVRITSEAPVRRTATLEPVGGVSEL